MTRPLNFMVLLYKGRPKDQVWHHLNLLPGLIPERVFDAMDCRVCEELGLCDKCDGFGCRCHILWQKPDNENAYSKLCPILFVDTVKPEFQLKDIA